METVQIIFNSQLYNQLVSVLADLPNRTNSYGLLVEIERQAKEQMDAFETSEPSNNPSE